MDLLKIVTAGSVDDGKSTLIGRLLYETNSLKDDQIEHIEQKSKSKGLAHFDFSLATDGLLTEREQGITIDVSNIYFKTEHRRFIITDSPGHIEYTRNMVTGASNADTTIILIDARKGVVEQTIRHLYITNLIGIKKIIIAINKMDLVGYNQSIFEEIKSQASNLIKKSKYIPETLFFLPISALKGDNITSTNSKMSWYNGKSLIQIIESLKVKQDNKETSAFHVQYVIRPQLEKYHDYRGFAGKIKSGEFQVGDSVQVFPSGQRSKIEKIEKYGIPIGKTVKDENASVLLIDNVDVSRGSVIIKSRKEFSENKKLVATICWMQNEKLEVKKKYWLQQGVQKVLTIVDAIESKMDFNKRKTVKTEALELNDIGEITLTLAQPIFSEPYDKNRALGAFILIDQNTFNTAGVGFIRKPKPTFN
jgi:sulfate adenylyltransferase subunit 1